MWHTPLEFDMDYTFGNAIGLMGALITKPEDPNSGYIMNYLNGTSQHIKLNNTILPYLNFPFFKFVDDTLFMFLDKILYSKTLEEGSEINFTNTDILYDASSNTGTIISFEVYLFKEISKTFLCLCFEDLLEPVSNNRFKIKIVTFGQAMQVLGTTILTKPEGFYSDNYFYFSDLMFDSVNNKIVLIGRTLPNPFWVGPYGFVAYVDIEGNFLTTNSNIYHQFAFDFESTTDIYNGNYTGGRFIGNSIPTPKIFETNFGNSKDLTILFVRNCNFKELYVNFVKFDLDNMIALQTQWETYMQEEDIPEHLLIHDFVTSEEKAFYDDYFIDPSLNFKVLSQNSQRKIILYAECVLYKEIGIDEFGDPIFEYTHKKPIMQLNLSTDLINPSTIVYKVEDDYVSDSNWGNYKYSTLDIFLHESTNLKIVAARPTFEVDKYPPTSLNYYLTSSTTTPTIPPPILAIFNKIAPQYATYTDSSTTPPKQTPLQYITHTTFYNEPPTDPPTTQDLQIKILPKDLKNFVSDDDDISFKVEFLNTLVETPNATTRLTPISILPPSILQISKSDWDNSNIGDVLVVSRHYENLPNDEFYTTYLQFKNNTFLILAKYEDNGKFYIGLDNAFPPYKNLANYLITTEKFNYQDILMLYYFHIRGNPLVESTQQLVYSTNETPERIYNLTSSLPIKYLQHLISHIVNLSPLIIEFNSLDHFEAGDYVLINEDIYFFTNGVYQIFLKTISPEKNTYQCIKVNHKSFGQTTKKTKTGTRLYIANTYTSATSNTPISSSDPTFYLTDKDLRTLTPKAGLFKYGGLLNTNWKILFDGTGKVATNTTVTTTVTWGNNTVSGKLFYQENDLLFTPTTAIPTYPHQNETLGLYESSQPTTPTIEQNTNTTNTNKTISVASILRDSAYLVLTTSQFVTGNSTQADFSAFDIKIWKTNKELGENIVKSEFENSTPYATAKVVGNSNIGIGNVPGSFITNSILPNEKYIIKIEGILKDKSKTNPTFLHIGNFTNTSETRFKAFS